jgi:hypothetical protein
LGQPAQYDTNGTLTDHEDGFAGFDGQTLHAFNTGIDGLDKAGLLKADAFRDGHGTFGDDPIHDADIFGESSARSFEAGSATDLLINIALGEGFMAAVKTFSAGNVMKDNDAVIYAEFFNTLADGGNYTCSFVSENAGRGVGAESDFFEVGAADAAGVNANQDLARADGGDWDSFDANVILAAIDSGLHSGWNYRSGFFDGGLRCGHLIGCDF